MGYVKRQIVFNTENTHQRELYEWVSAQSGGNFSGFVRTVLFAFKSGGGGTREVQTFSPAFVAQEDSDRSAMGDII